MTRDQIVPAADRKNVLVVSVRLSQDDVASLQERAEKYGVGVSTYIRILVREHLETGRNAAGPLALGSREMAMAEVAASRE